MNWRLKLPRRILVLFLLFSGGLAVVAHADSLRTVALSGAAASGTSGTFSSFGAEGPVLTNSGQTAFLGEITGSGVNGDNDSGLWSEGGGALALLAREGSVAPGTSVSFASAFSNPILNGAGQTAFLDSLTGAGVDTSNDNGIWSEGGGSLGLVAREGDGAPGTSGDFSFLFNPVFNSAGQTAFRGFLTGAGVDDSNENGIWSEGSGPLALVAREGSGAPGTSGDFDAFDSPVLNGAGQVAFVGNLTGSGVDSSNDGGIWSEGGGSLALVTREGSGAPGTSGDFSAFDRPALNSAGQTAFLGRLTGPGIDSSNENGVWSEGSGALALVAREGSGAPGTSGDFSFFFGPVLNSAGETAFQGFLTGAGVSPSNDNGIWSEGGGSLDLVARAGDGAPGTSVDFSAFESPAINSGGQSAFLGFLTGAGVDSSNNNGIWAQDQAGVLTLIAREGDLLDVDDGAGTEFRTISDLSLVVGSGNQEGRGSSFNDLGQIAFRAGFTDGSSGIFVSDLAAGIAGDYNGDGSVNAADYTVWRDHLGAPAGSLQNDVDGGIIGADQYSTWKTNFGQMAPSAASLPFAAAIPEPTSLCLLAIGTILLAVHSRRSVGSIE